MLFLMMIFEKLAEERIVAAMQRGEFNNLPGAGSPLPDEDLSMVPEEWRMAYRVLKNAGYIPPEMKIQQEINRIESELAREPDDEERLQQSRKLFCLFQQLNDRHQRLMHLSLQEHYYRKILQRLSGT